MNIEEARSVSSLKNKPGPLGELLEEGYLTQITQILLDTSVNITLDYEGW